MVGLVGHCREDAAQGVVKSRESFSAEQRRGGLPALIGVLAAARRLWTPYWTRKLLALGGREFRCIKMVRRRRQQKVRLGTWTKLWWQGGFCFFFFFVV